MTETNPTAQRWIGRPAQRDGARMRLFCLPFAGGGAAVFWPWVKHLPDDIELCLVQLPGRETRVGETPYSSMEELVSDLAPALAPLLDRPFALFGHSMGALIAYALTRQLQATGRPQPAHLFVSARRPPQIQAIDAPIHQLPDAAFVAAIVRRYNGIPDVILKNPALLRLFLPTLRADFTLIETYRYVEGPPLDCPITAFGGWEDARATQVDLAAWRDLTRAPFALRMFPGGHFFIQSAAEPITTVITGTLAVELARKGNGAAARQYRQAEPEIPASAPGIGDAT